MNRSTIIYIALLLVLCAGSYWLGTRQRQEAIVESTDTKIEVDTTTIDTPKPPVVVKPTEDKVIDRLPMVNYDALKDQIVDSLIAAGWYVQNTHIPDLDNILPDSIDVELPISQSIFIEEGKYEIGVSGYKNNLDYVKLFNTNTTITNTWRSPVKHWSVNASINSFTCQGMTDMSAGLGIEYQKDRWTFSGGYQVGFNGQSGATFGIQRTIFNF